MTLVIASTALAQPSRKASVLKSRQTTPMRMNTTLKSMARVHPQQQAFKAIPQGKMEGLKHDGIKAPWQRKMAKRTPGMDVLWDQPEGDYKVYSRSGEYFTYTMFGMGQDVMSDGLGEVVFGPNSEVYIRNITSQYPVGVWITGELQGSTITFDMPQKVFTSDDGYTYFFMMLKYDAESGDFIYDASITSFSLDYDAATGIISTPADSPLATGELTVSLADDEGEWAGESEWNFTFIPMTETPVTAPEGLTTEDYSVQAEGFNGNIAQVGFDGNDVYVQGIIPELPDAWIKGTIEGEKAIFKSGQYMGVGGGELTIAAVPVYYHQYLMSANAEVIYDEEYDYEYTYYELSDGDIVFDYDPATKTFSNSSAFLINAGKTKVNYLTAFDKAILQPFTEIATTPQAPENVVLDEGGYAYYMSGMGWGSIMYELASTDADGNFLLPEKTSVAFYVKVNGEELPLTFSNEDYTMQEEPLLTELPVNYSDGWDIGMYGTTHYLYYYVIGAEAFGVQTIYRGGDEERRSDIVWVEATGLGSKLQPEAATPDYPDVDPANAGSTIDYGPYTGEDDFYFIGEGKAENYDVAMRVQDPDVVGTHIDAISIPIQDFEGLSNVRVWLSSQLRIENGTAAPDLVSIDVEPTEPGMVTVQLPKPYTIPAEGVYVGYSLTVDEVVSEETESPIVVLGNGREGGMYLHTSQGFLKWIDISEPFDETAYIQLSISGSSVKENAASPREGDIQYAKAGETIPVDVTLVNHGAKGIQSVDMEFTINGNTTSEHITLDEPVAESFGFTGVISATIPAINELGDYELQYKVVKVNGVDNEDASPAATMPIKLLNTVPKHRALLEEYTGTWCGNCPRGFVGLEKLAKLYPDEYVLVSYHNGDPMQIIEERMYPSAIVGYPDSWIDRVKEVDPYYGSGNKNFGIADEMAARNKKFGKGAIDIKASLNTTDNTITVSTDVAFPDDIDEANLALEYILVEDGLSDPDDKNWNQVNYYEGGDDGEDLRPFNEAGHSVVGLVYNDVAILMSQVGGIEGSLPAAIVADEVYKHTYQFNLDEAINYKGENLVRPGCQLRVIVLLVDTQTGEVYNANKLNVEGTTGIGAIVSDNTGRISYYDASGRKLSTMQKGFNIVRMSDGTTKKVVCK